MRPEYSVLLRNTLEKKAKVCRMQLNSEVLLFHLKIQILYMTSLFLNVIISS